MQALLPRDAAQSTVLPRQVVRPSVCPSVTLRYRGHIQSDPKSDNTSSSSSSIIIHHHPHHGEDEAGLQ